jgi:hypothetical protein
MLPWGRFSDCRKLPHSNMHNATFHDTFGCCRNRQTNIDKIIAQCRLQHSLESARELSAPFLLVSLSLARI